MMFIDVNLLIYAFIKDAPFHLGRPVPSKGGVVAGSRDLRKRNGGLALERSSRVPPIDNEGRIFQKPWLVETAFDLIDAWLQQPRHLRTVRDLVLPLGTGGNLTSDAHLAALAIRHGAELCSTDNDFARFRGLRWRNTLV